MSAAMVARAMMYDDPAGRSDLYGAWVKLLLKQFGKSKLRDILAASSGEGRERLAAAPSSRPRADA